ncbi:MAG: hypothetical protein K5644_09870 [Lachnospiraceae bacterium]|nr:hypothetical protein [Lachnospiraceae bacterium]
MAVASLVLGIIALVLSFTGGFGWIGTIVAIVGIILGALGRKDPEKKGMATAGLVCCIIAAVLDTIVAIACLACVGAAGVASTMA